DGASPGVPAVRRRRSGPAWLPLQDQRRPHLSRDGRRFGEREAMAAGIVQRETPPHVLQPDARTTAPRLRTHESPCILDLDVQRLTLCAHDDAELESTVTTTVLDGILDQRLQQEARDAARRSLGLDLHRDLETRAEASLLYPEIGREPRDLG